MWNVLWIIVYPYVLLCIALFVLLRGTVSDYPFVIFKLFKQTLNPETTSPDITPIKKSNSKYATESVI
jgi:hypothetical protein